jgi:RNA 3'-terminal phosphate cyclase
MNAPPFDFLAKAFLPVAAEAVESARAYLASGAAVSEHLTDQLLLPFALAGGGAFTAEKLNMHARTNMNVIKRFLPVDFRSDSRSGLPKSSSQPHRAIVRLQEEIIGVHHARG